MKKINVATILSIAGSDSSGGAGIQADIKTISALGGYAASVITALTAQNTQGIQMIYPIPADFVRAQLESVLSDLSVCAVKIGMLFDENIVTVVASVLKKYKPKYVVLDPVMVAKSRHELLKSETLSVMKEKLFSEVSLITPNIFEAEKILNVKIENAEQQEQSAIKIGEQFQINVLVKGGHLQHSEASDVLYILSENRCEWFHAPRIETHNTHGTGCSLSSAIAAELAKNHSLVDSVSHAKRYLTEALHAAKTSVFGQGVGPVNHFYNLR